MSNIPYKIVKKKWGEECWFSLTKDYCFKKITIYAGHKTSLQYHEEKEETNVVVSGKGLVYLQKSPHGRDVDVREISPGDFFHFLPGFIHRFEAIEDLVIYEASSKQIDDVVRLEDVYGRQGTSTP